MSGRICCWSTGNRRVPRCCNWCDWDLTVSYLAEGAGNGGHKNPGANPPDEWENPQRPPLFPSTPNAPSREGRVGEESEELTASERPFRVPGKAKHRKEQ